MSVDDAVEGFTLTSALEGESSRQHSLLSWISSAFAVVVGLLSRDPLLLVVQASQVF